MPPRSVPMAGWSPSAELSDAICRCTTPSQAARSRSIYSAHAAPISAIAFSGDGAKLATADAEGTIKIWADARQSPRRALR